jgi:hypothetical protein
MIGELFPRRQSPTQVERGVDQGLRPHRRRQAALGLMQGDRHQPAAGAVAGHGDAARVEPKRVRLVRQPCKRRDGVLHRCGERMLRCQPIVERQHRGARVVTQRAAQYVVGFDVAEDAASTMHEQDRRFA